MGTMKIWDGATWQLVAQNGPAGPPTIPAAGTTGQVLAKNSPSDYDVGWQTITQPTPSGTVESALAYSPGLVVPPNTTGSGYNFNITIPRAGNLYLAMNAVVNQSGTNGYQVGYLRMTTPSGGYPVSFGPTSVIQDNAANFGVHTVPMLAVYNGVGAGSFPFRLNMDTGPGPASLRISEFFGVYRLNY